jgi:hypothetical protein
MIELLKPVDEGYAVPTFLVAFSGEQPRTGVLG